MDERQKREYQSVILGALLHDIGKFIQKPEGKSTAHPLDGSNFLAQYKEHINNIGFDFETINNIVQFHQNGEYARKVTNPQQKNLVTIIASSDSAASGERDYEMLHEKHNEKKLSYYPLGPVFAHIKLDLDEELDIVKNYKKEEYHYKHEILSFSNIFPSCYPLPEDNGAKEIIKSNYKILKDGFKEDFEKLLNGILSIKDQNQKMNVFLVSLYSLLYKYTWCIPDEVGRKIRDISLFDHTRISAAISACLYVFHYKNNSLNNVERVSNESKFLLIEGDLSGIQDYLYDIANVGVGGVAKRLRTRSFFLQVLVEVVSHRILHEVVGEDIELPLMCKIMSSGGNFIILAPMIPGIENRLATINKELNEWLFKEFQGDLSFSIASLPITGNDFEIKRPSHESYITQKLTDLHELLEMEKSRKLFCFLASNDNNSFRWNEDSFLWEEKPFPYGDCPSCKKNPAKTDSNHADERLCERCASDRRFSEEFINAHYICYSKEKLMSKKNNVYEFFYGTEKYWVILAENEGDIPSHAYLVQIGSPESMIYNKPVFLNPYANYVSFFKNEEDLNEYCKKSCGKESLLNTCDFYRSLTDRNYQTEKGIKPSGFPAVKPFDCLASSLDSEKLLGITKADVDRLGFIFKKGLGDDKTSLSRIATLSRMLDLFFSGWMDYTIQNNEKFHETYTIYSGGDDLMLVGPWDKIIDLSTHIANNFRSYVAYNPQVTISTGIAATKPKFPIAKSSKLAGAFLDKAKEGELLKETGKYGKKNRLHLFGTTAVWFKKRREEVEIKKLMEWSEKILKGMEDTSDQRITSGEVYSILKYSEMCKEWLAGEGKCIENLRYLSLLAYIIGRKRKDKNTLECFKVFIDDINEQNLFAKFRIPITRALLKYRGRRDKSGTI